MDNLVQLIINTFIVFAITLVITKSNILAEKRSFVQKRYEAAKLNGRPNFIHRCFYAHFTCPMCSGFHWSVIICLFVPVQSFFIDVLFIFGLNWLIHCVENCLFQFGKNQETKN